MFKDKDGVGQESLFNVMKVLFFVQTVVALEKGKGKAEHLNSALHGIQTTSKRSGMDHTV